MTTFAYAMEALTPDMASAPAPLLEVARRLQRGEIEGAATGLKAFLERHPNDALGLYWNGDIARQRERYAECEAVFARAIELAPDFIAARFRLVNTLLEVGKVDAALAQAEELLRQDAANPVFRALKAMALELLDDHAAAAEAWHVMVRDAASPECWVRYAHVLRGLGRTEEAVAACRKAIALDPAFGRAWWALASLKSSRFSDADMAQMEKLAQRPDLPAGDRAPLLFSLGKAHADRKDYEKSFALYARGNAQRRMSLHHDPATLTAYVARCKTTFTAEFFHAREGYGCDRRAPIFLVGMLRSGSTLVEQILASHSQVEGTRELPALGTIAHRLETDIAKERQALYPQVLGVLDADELRALGEQYLESIRPYRKLGVPRVIDKMGRNFLHLGLIHLVLPNAKIVDVRRHPLACGWSNFTQLYANGQVETYRLSDFAALYRDYAELMVHFDSVLPGKVHRVIYERLVIDPEGEIRALLDYLDLPFEAACLDFHNNARAVSTISSEQVRAPLYREALEHWRHYERWLGPLKSALGSLAETYPEFSA